MELLSDIISIFDHKSVKLSFNKNILNINHNNQNYQLCLEIYDNNMIIKPYNNRVENVHLVSIINNNKFNDINHIYELLEFIVKEIPTITNYCTCCYKKMLSQSDKYITCGSNECDYKYEELIIDDVVLDKLKYDQDIVYFLIQSAEDAYKNRKDIFEPFPTQFLKENIQLERKTISKLKGISLDKYKDFQKLSECFEKLDFNKLIKMSELVSSDYDLARSIGEDVYKLIRFIIMSCKVNIVKDDTILNKKKSEISIYKIIHPSDINEQFIKNSNNKTFYLFHGSRWYNWYSILRNGLKNCSNTQMMTTGAAYGNGVYLSDNLNIAISYGRYNNKSVAGIFEIIGNKSDYLKAPGIYVVSNDNLLIQRYLIITNKGSKYTTELNNIFNTKIYEEKEKTTTIIYGKGIKKIIKEYKNIIKLNPESIGFRIEVDSNNMYLWNVFLFGYDKNDPIGKDMIKYNVKEIKMEITFPSSYPLSPPFVRIIKPRFQYLTGHITSGGSICTQILTDKYWSPACSIESLIMTIKAEILEGDGRLDPKLYNIEYSKKEAEESFIRVAKGHGWV